MPEHGNRSTTNHLVPKSTLLGYLRRGKRSACKASCSRKAEQQLPDQPAMPPRCSSETELLRPGRGHAGLAPIPLPRACLPGRLPGTMSQMPKPKTVYAARLAEYPTETKLTSRWRDGGYRRGLTRRQLASHCPGPSPYSAPTVTWTAARGTLGPRTNE